MRQHGHRRVVIVRPCSEGVYASGDLEARKRDEDVVPGARHGKKDLHVPVQHAERGTRLERLTNWDVERVVDVGECAHGEVQLDEVWEGSDDEGEQSVVVVREVIEIEVETPREGEGRGVRGGHGGQLAYVSDEAEEATFLLEYYPFVE